jgi:flagellar hook-length control protein FliK
MNPTSLLTGLGAAVSAEPTLGAVNGTGRATASGTADLFMALVAGLLDGQGAGTPGGAAAEAPATDGEPLDAMPVAADATTGEQPAGADLVDLEPDAADLVAVPMAVPVIVQPAMIAQAVPAAGQAGTTEPVGSVDPAAAAVAPAVADVPSAAPASGATSQDAAGQDATHQDAPHQDAGTPAAPAAPAGPSTAATPGTPAAGSAPASVTAVAAAPAAPVAPVAPVDTAAAPATHRVSEQVFPEVVRVSASTVDGGPRRVTVKLNPESLGEVRVVLTSRRGELEVSLAAGQDARRALVEGAPELHRLLEAVGRTDSRIVFRDLPTTAPVAVTAQDGAPRTDVSTDLGGNAWSGAGRPGGEPAADRDGTRQHSGSTTATDGTTSATPGSRPATTSGRSHSGVDLTM